VTASVVADSSPIIAYNACDRLSLLRELYGSILIPPAVAGEISPSAPRLPEWVHVERQESFLPIHLSRGLDPGETAAIALAISTGATTVLFDDLAARLRAERLGLHVVGSLGVAIRAKRLGIIPSARVIIDDLVSTGLYVSKPLYARAPALSGESD
jgi:uncharacterized protein